MTSLPLSDERCFALLDDSEADAQVPRSRLYTGYAGTLTCDDAAGLKAMFESMQESQRNGLHAVGLFDYELGAQMQGIPVKPRKVRATLLLFRQCERLSADAVSAWLEQRELDEQGERGNASSSPAGIANVRSSVTETEFAQQIDAIRTYIEAGDIYQLNYTFRVTFDAFGSPCGLYSRLRERQPVPYGALIGLPDGGAVLSLSPELFVQYRDGELTAQPMKGTAAASGDEQVDAARAAALAADDKNRAENLMIVDLLRNDLGRIAQTGSVKVPKLFEVSRHSSVLQMTSTVTAVRRADASLADIFAALFPCGSVTGAPKRRAMQIIHDIEGEPRGLYTGAIGWFEAAQSEADVGDFCLNVPIRTLTLSPEAGGIRRGVMGVGAGIVHDSTAESEYAECMLKAGFLTGLANEFELIETMHATRAQGCRHLDLHLRRLQASAQYFGFAFDRDAVCRQVENACRVLDGDEEHRLRLALRRDGSCVLQGALLAPLAEPVRVIVSPSRVRADDVFLRHKTTVRDRYDDAWREAEKQGAFDMLFFNERDELTEGARSSVLLKLNGQWLTPPLSSGLLPGVMRAALLANAALELRESVLTESDLRHAEEIAICNALRGMVKAQLVS